MSTSKHNDLQILHRKPKSNTKPTKTENELRCSGWLSISCSSSINRRVTFKRHEHNLNGKVYISNRASLT